MTGDLFSLLSGDCRDRLAELDDDSVDAIVTDPPYELGFMGKRWDASGIAYDVAMWAECLRVVKPGGYLLAFGGTRTYHRMVCAIEDAGFDIRDSLHWVYGSGFPKSLDVSKAIDKAAGAERAVGGKHPKPGSTSPRTSMGDGWQLSPDITAPATDAAVEWEGWGTALKPAHEPIVVARKPLSGTVAATVLEFGTGALNIDGCRVGFASEADEQESKTKNQHADFGTEPGGNKVYGDYSMIPRTNYNPPGRWPANIVLTHAADCGESCAEGCPVAELDGQSGVSKDGVAVRRNLPPEGKPQNSPTSWSKPARQDTDMGYGGQGGASRFFAASEWSPEFDVPFIYTAKPSRAERNDGLGHLPGGHTDFGGNGRPGAGFNEVTHGTAPTPAPNYHPTVKPVALMRYLVRLVTRRGGTILDPFAGSGTTMVAAILEERFPIGIELTDEYHPIILGRCEHAAANLQMALF